MLDIQVLYNHDGVSVIAYITEENCLDIEYYDNKCPFADNYEHHTTLTQDATQKLCEMYQCDIMQLPQKVKEHLLAKDNQNNLKDIQVEGKSVDEVWALYKEVTIEGRFQKFCDENHLEYKTFLWTSDNDDFDVKNGSGKGKQRHKKGEKKFNEFIDAIGMSDKVKIRTMIKEGFGVNMADENGRTALMFAMMVGDLSVIKMLIKAGANLEQKAQDDETAFLYACRFTKNVKVIEYLIKQGVNTQAKNIYGNNALFVAAEYNKSWKVVEYLINTKLYDINDQDCKCNYTPLMAAVRFNTVDVVNVLIDHGANLYAKDVDGWLPVLHAAANDDDNPMNLIRLIGLDPRLFTFKAGEDNLRLVSEHNHNLNIRMALDSILSIYLSFSKTPSKEIPN